MTPTTNANVAIRLRLDAMMQPPATLCLKCDSPVTIERDRCVCTFCGHAGEDFLERHWLIEALDIASGKTKLKPEPEHVRALVAELAATRIAADAMKFARPEYAPIMASR